MKSSISKMKPHQCIQIFMQPLLDASPSQYYHQQNQLNCIQEFDNDLEYSKELEQSFGSKQPIIVKEFIRQIQLQESLKQKIRQKDQNYEYLLNKNIQLEQQKNKIETWLKFLQDENKNLTQENEQIKEILIQKGIKLIFKNIIQETELKEYRKIGNVNNEKLICELNNELVKKDQQINDLKYQLSQIQIQFEQYEQKNQNVQDQSNFFDFCSIKQKSSFASEITQNEKKLHEQIKEKNKAIEELKVQINEMADLQEKIQTYIQVEHQRLKDRLNILLKNYQSFEHLLKQPNKEVEVKKFVIQSQQDINNYQLYLNNIENQILNKGNQNSSIIQKSTQNESKINNYIEKIQGQLSQRSLKSFGSDSSKQNMKMLYKKINQMTSLTAGMMSSIFDYSSLKIPHQNEFSHD